MSVADLYVMIRRPAQRDNQLCSLTNVQISPITYPNCILHTDQGILNPYDERIMSLQVSSGLTTIDKQQPEISNIETRPCFFFIYNFDNYYHFLYDTLPLLFYYLTVLEQQPKILINTNYKSQRKYVREAFELLGLRENNFIVVNETTSYTTLYVSTSWTHGKAADGSSMSCAKPNMEAYYVWRRMAQQSVGTCAPKKIYISRRSWIHGDTSNIGTNYTTRRKCMNENAVVEYLTSVGYIEVFLELMTMSEKIAMFASATHVIGVIGGGMCNLIFSPQETSVICMITPHFDTINERFKYSMDHTNIAYLSNCTHHLGHQPPPFPLYSRILVIDQEHEYYDMIGETEEWDHIEQKWTVRMSQNDVAGFAADRVFPCISFSPWQVSAIDQGLNSPYDCDISTLKAALSDQK